MIILNISPLNSGNRIITSKNHLYEKVSSQVRTFFDKIPGIYYAFLKIEKAYSLLWNGTTVNWPFLYSCLSNVHTFINEACYAMTVRHFKWSVRTRSRQESTTTYFLRLTFIFLQNSAVKTEQQWLLLL